VNPNALSDIIFTSGKIGSTKDAKKRTELRLGALAWQDDYHETIVPLD
jgi:hypothetical protein